MMRIEDVELKYLDKETILSKKYFNFLERYYGEKTGIRLRRITWYKTVGVAILVAVLGDDFVGQSCAYKATAVINHLDKEWWWGIDSFVLSEYRGNGIGKLLQKKLHEDFPNFSSAQSSNANYHIKKQLGASEIFKYQRHYYAVSSYVTPIINSIIQKIFNVKVKSIRIPYLYYRFNNFLYRNEYIVEELDVLSKEDMKYIESSLKKFDFYIKRDKEFFKWKYYDNPNLKFKIIKISDIQENLKSIVMFSDVYEARCIRGKIRGVNILDVFTDEFENFTMKQVIIAVANYFQKKKICVDMIVACQKFDYYPNFISPKGRYVLSTLQEKITKPYLSMIDHDMEQMDAY